MKESKLSTKVIDKELKRLHRAFSKTEDGKSADIILRRILRLQELLIVNAKRLNGLEY
jgi:hypothetical protein